MLFTASPVQRPMRRVQRAKDSVDFKKLRLSTVVSAHFPKVLPTQQLDDLCVSHQSQVTCSSLLCEAVPFSSVTIPGETFHCANRFVVVREEGPAEGLFGKESAPPPPEIQNSTAPPSAPWDPIEAGVFNTSNRSEEIALVSNQGLEVDDDMEPAPEKTPLVDTPAADILFEG